MQLGFIGLGTMGRPMALHLMRGGHTMAVYARRPETARPLIDEGAVVCPSPAAVAERCERVILSLMTTAIVREVVGGADGLLSTAGRPAHIIDTTTGDPEDTVALAAQLSAAGIAYLDATISGSSEQIRPVSYTHLTLPTKA